MKHQGCSIIFYNKKSEILLFLRDDKNNIPYPNTWDLLGGHLEAGESPEECIIREMKEELNLELSDFSKFAQIEFHDRTEHTYFKKLDVDLIELSLREGQKLSWFRIDDLAEIDLAFGFKPMIDLFCREVLDHRV